MKKIIAFLAGAFSLSVVAAPTESPVYVMLLGNNPGINKEIDKLAKVESISEVMLSDSTTKLRRKIKYIYSGGISEYESRKLIAVLSVSWNWELLQNKWNLSVEGSNSYARLTIEDQDCEAKNQWLAVKEESKWVSINSPNWAFCFTPEQLPVQ